MQYLIYRTSIPSQFIDIQLTLAVAEHETIELQLPAWRPGRYELANYAQKLRHLKVVNSSGERIRLQQHTKDRWSFTSLEKGSYRIQYQFHASQMDAGGSWSDDEQLYINFINLAFQVIGREEEEITVRLDLPENYKLATALPCSSPRVLNAEGFQHLVDSPLIASPALQHFVYEVYDHSFHLWFQGEIHFDTEQLLHHFAQFSKAQIDAFGSFPADHYHFLFQILPYSHYHGVEHQFSTVITLGPAEDLSSKAFMDRLMGVSSHELYHFWNVCRIRPKELLPYDFSKEAYFDAGIVAEGVTTYMGDFFLWKSGYYSDRDYLDVLEKLINREFEQFGWKNQSIVESSWDLWLDGYKAGIPDRKVSIYNRGALISLCLDLMLLRSGSSLSQVMKKMWDNFGQKGIGYELKDFKLLVAEGLEDETAAEAFFSRFVYGTEHLLPLLKDCLEAVGIALHEERWDDLATDYGIILDEEAKVKSVHSESPAYHQIMIGDLIHNQQVQQSPEGDLLILSIKRYGRDLRVTLPKTADAYFKRYRLYIQTANELNHWKDLLNDQMHKF
jgi:predicted metalloprotease with PDZ domain